MGLVRCLRLGRKSERWHAKLWSTRAHAHASLRNGNGKRRSGSSDRGRGKDDRMAEVCLWETVNDDFEKSTPFPRIMLPGTVPFQANSLESTTITSQSAQPATKRLHYRHHQYHHHHQQQHRNSAFTNVDYKLSHPIYF